MSKDAVADDLAEALAAQRQAGRDLHDNIGPLLSAAGLRLQLLRMDFPDAGERVGEVMETLDDAMERVRALSQELCPSPVYRAGFKNALTSLAESSELAFKGVMRFAYSSEVQLPVEIAVATYESAAIAVKQAMQSATRIDISVTGTNSLRLRIKDDGRRRRQLVTAAALARHAGLTFEVSTGKGTIVSIEYTLRRPSRG